MASARSPGCRQRSGMKREAVTTPLAFSLRCWCGSLLMTASARDSAFLVATLLTVVCHRLVPCFVLCRALPCSVGQVLGRCCGSASAGWGLARVPPHARPPCTPPIFPHAPATPHSSSPLPCHHAATAAGTHRPRLSHAAATGGWALWWQGIGAVAGEGGRPGRCCPGGHDRPTNEAWRIYDEHTVADPTASYEHAACCSRALR